MLPFLKNKQKIESGASNQYRKPDENVEKREDQHDGLETAAHELMVAIASGDKKGFAQALRAAFQILDSEPHYEGPHENE